MKTKEEVQLVPLFPLGSTLFPDGGLALHIFEVRYLTMIKKCYELALPFGVVTLSSGSETMKPNESIEFSQIGTLAFIEKFEALQPTLYKIFCTGRNRFRIKRTEKSSYGLWQAEIELLADDPIIPIPTELLNTSEALSKLIQAMNAQNFPSEQRPFHEPYQLEDCGWVANRWADILKLTPGQKEQLLGLENPRLRLDLVAEILSENNFLT